MKKLYNKINREELKKKILEDQTERITLSFYQYANISDPHSFRDDFYVALEKIGVLGRIYVAKEGVNGQISIPASKKKEFKKTLYGFDFLEGIRLNYAIEDDGKSFFKLAIKVRKKIVADGLNDETFDVTKRGRKLNAMEVNELLQKDETVVVDMRNHYESEVGHFKGAICPDVETFREALPLVENMLEERKKDPIIMYCTGGIRCEKASAYYLHKGFEQIYMIDGGIIEYSRECEELGLENNFIGKNFVFDERLGERISEEIISKCHQCGKPSDGHVNCANNACHILFIQCEECADKYDQCCSQTCQDFTKLPKEEQKALFGKIEFNGSKFGKGRYKAAKGAHSLT